MSANIGTKGAANNGAKGAANITQPEMTLVEQDNTSVRQIGQRQSLPCFLADISSFVQTLHRIQDTTSAPSDILCPDARWLCDYALTQSWKTNVIVLASCV